LKLFRVNNDLNAVDCFIEKSNIRRIETLLLARLLFLCRRFIEKSNIRRIETNGMQIQIKRDSCFIEKSNIRRIETFSPRLTQCNYVKFYRKIQHKKDWNPPILKLCAISKAVTFYRKIQHKKDWNCKSAKGYYVDETFYRKIQHKKDWNRGSRYADS